MNECIKWREARGRQPKRRMGWRRETHPELRGQGGLSGGMGAMTLSSVRKSSCPCTARGRRSEGRTPLAKALGGRALGEFEEREGNQGGRREKGERKRSKRRSDKSSVGRGGARPRGPERAVRGSELIPKRNKRHRRGFSSPGRNFLEQRLVPRKTKREVQRFPMPPAVPACARPPPVSAPPPEGCMCYLRYVCSASGTAGATPTHHYRPGPPFAHIRVCSRVGASPISDKRIIARSCHRGVEEGVRWHVTYDFKDR